GGPILEAGSERAAAIGTERDGRDPARVRGSGLERLVGREIPMAQRARFVDGIEPRALRWSRLAERDHHAGSAQGQRGGERLASGGAPHAGGAIAAGGRHLLPVITE